MELLKQKQYSPLDVEEEVVILFAGTEGYLSDIPTKKILAFEKDFLQFMHRENQEVLSEIKDTKDLSDDLKNKLKSIIESFLKTYKA
jgi:F-type H+-transporting ATPase subunit alpha